METDKLSQTAQRTEEVRDIIDRMPYRTDRVVPILVTGLCALLTMVFSIIIMESSLVYPMVRARNTHNPGPMPENHHK